MVDLLSPFVTKELACPACMKTYPQRFFRQRSYVAEDKESDQHVLSYQWMNDKYKKVHPPYYFLFFCPSCFFVDTSEEYSKPYATDFGPMLIRRFKHLTAEEQTIVESLASGVNYEEIDFESALRLHLLALFIHSRPEEDARDTYKLARTYLRVAWLYREQDAALRAVQEAAGVTDDPSEAPMPAPGPDFRAMLLQATIEYESTLEKHGEGWNRVECILKDRLNELAQEMGDTQDYEYEPCRDLIEGALRQLGEGLAQLRAACEQDRADASLRALASAESQRSLSEGLRAFLGRTKARWNDLPLDEEEAMRMAIKHFQKAILVDTRLSSHETYFMVVYLVADLFIRCNDHEGALRMISGIYKSGMDARRTYMEQARKPGLTETDKLRLHGRINKVNLSLEKTGDFRRDLIDQLIERDQDTIKKVISRCAEAGVSMKQVEQVLTEAGLMREIVPRLRERGRLAAFK